MKATLHKGSKRERRRMVRTVRRINKREATRLLFTRRCPGVLEAVKAEPFLRWTPIV